MPMVPGGRRRLTVAGPRVRGQAVEAARDVCHGVLSETGDADGRPGPVSGWRSPTREGSDVWRVMAMSQRRIEARTPSLARAANCEQGPQPLAGPSPRPDGLAFQHLCGDFLINRPGIALWVAPDV